MELDDGGDGFVGKNLECADQLLRESDRDATARGRKMREIGLAIIASMIRALPAVPLQATGYDLSTGKPHDHVWLAPWLRAGTCGLVVGVEPARTTGSSQIFASLSVSWT